MKAKRILSLLLAVLLLFSVDPLSGSAADEIPKIDATEESGFSDQLQDDFVLTDAANPIPMPRNAGVATAGDYSEFKTAFDDPAIHTIILTADIGFENETRILTRDLTIESDPSASLSCTMRVTADQRHFVVEGAKLTLKSVIVDSHYSGTNYNGGITAKNGGSLILDGVTISNVSGTAVTASDGANISLNNVMINTATNGITGSGTLSITNSALKNITTTAVTAGSGNVTFINSEIDGVANGKGIAAGSGTLDVTGSTLKNIKGSGIAGASGTITVEDATFSDINGIGINDGSNVIVKNTLFEKVQNNLGGHGSAIFSRNNLTVEDSSFVNSASTIDGGYIQGAIIAYGGYSGRTVSVTRSYFKDNHASRYGGAIGFYQFGGDVNISYSYFEGNGVSGKNANSDGGAIGVFNGNSSVICTFDIDSNTFYGNTAQDDGSAIFVESRNGTVTSNITNNTFYGNMAGKFILPVDSGGVVQLSLDTVANFVNNTFYNNTTSTLSNKNGCGSAVGQHIDSANENVRPAASFMNNIMVGNGGITSGSNLAYKNVDITNADDHGGNIGYDNGAPLAPNITPANVFGTFPQLQTNHTSYGAVGKAGSGYTKELPTIIILPDGPADNAAIVNELSLTEDARGYMRDSSKPDAGAVEIKYVKFDANGGAWSGLPALEYDGLKYYADATASTGYYLVSHPGGDVSILTSDLPINGSLIFDGWYTATAGGTMVEGTVSVTDQTLYAQWTENSGGGGDPAVQYTVTYIGNGADTDTVPSEDTATENTTYTVNATPPTRSGHTFSGWKADDEAGTVYQPGEAFTMPSRNVMLTAQWTENSGGGGNKPAAQYTVTYVGNGADTDTVPPIDTVTENTTYTVNTTPPIRSGYTFTGWKADDTAGTVYQPGGIFTMPSRKVMLTAQWKKNSGGSGGVNEVNIDEEDLPKASGELDDVPKTGEIGLSYALYVSLMLISWFALGILTRRKKQE